MCNNIENNVIEALQNADEPLHVNEIAKRSGETENYVKICIREQSGLGNIGTVHTKGRNGNRYEWIGVLGLSEEIKKLNKELEMHETPKPEGEITVGKSRETQGSVFMVVVNGETRLCATKDEAYEIGDHEAARKATVFIYEVVKVNQVVYKPTIVAHDLASLCS